MKKHLLTTAPRPAITIDPRLSIKDLELALTKVDSRYDSPRREAILKRLAHLAIRDCGSKRDFKTAERIALLLRNYEEPDLCASVQEKIKAVKTLCGFLPAGDRLLEQASSAALLQIGEGRKNAETIFFSEKSLLLHSIRNSLEFAIEKHQVFHANIMIREKLIKLMITPTDTVETIVKRLEANLGSSLSEVRLIAPCGEGLLSILQLMLQASKLRNANVAFIHEDNLFVVSPQDSMVSLITYYQAKIDLPIDLNRSSADFQINQRAA